MRSRFTVHAFAESAEGGSSLSEGLDAPLHPIDVHVFPDSESLVTARNPGEVAVIYRPLHQPNTKLIEVVLAASALRDQGARVVILVAPYLPYMRQDAAFAPGQAVSQRVVGAVLAEWFDGFVTVAPHLHRTRDLGTVFPRRPAMALTPVDTLAALIKRTPDPNIVLLGPDIESEPLVQAVAAAVGARFGTASKARRGDTDVDLLLPPTLALKGRRVILVDDMISTGQTLIGCAREALLAGAASVEALACHALFGEDVARQMAAAGIHRVRSCDGVPHPTNAAALGPQLAIAVRDVCWTCEEDARLAGAPAEGPQP